MSAAPRISKITGKPVEPRKKWAPIIEEARRIAASFVVAITLRQLHYLLSVSGHGGYRNTEGDYKQLSSRTAELRREGWDANVPDEGFPPLSDTTRGVNRPTCFDDDDDARQWLKSIYRRDRTEGQTFQVWVLYEKATLGAQIEAWLDAYGIPNAALRGYSSESLEREVFEAMVQDGREVVVFYVGDLDPEGEDIERNFIDQAKRLGIRFRHWKRLGVTTQQAKPKPRGLGLVANPGKPESSRAAKFIAKHGQLFQIEAEAIDPAVLERLVLRAVTDAKWFDQVVYDACLMQEDLDRASL